MKLAVLYRDEHLLIVDKPAGMLVHRGWGRAALCLTDLVRAQSYDGRAFPVQRLDRAASGVMVFAQEAQIARHLQEQHLDKRYWVLVRGTPPDAGVIDHAIQRREGGPRVEARTEFRTLQTAACEPRAVALVEAVPLTGRPHQLRRHFKHINHPILGDTTYGKGSLNRAFQSRYGLARLALHACAVSLLHPSTGQAVEVTAPLPENLAQPFRRMGIVVA